MPDIKEILGNLILFGFFVLGIFFLGGLIYGGYIFFKGIVAWLSTKIEMTFWQEMAVYVFLGSMFLAPIVKIFLNEE